MKRLTGIFICLLAVLLMSHNTFAVGLNVPVRLVRTNNNLTFESNNYSASLCHANATGGYWSSGNCQLNSNMVYGVYTEYLTGDILELDIYLLINQVNNSLDASLYNFFPSTTGFELIGSEMEMVDTSLGVAKYYLRATQYISMPQGGVISFNGTVYLFENEIIYAKSSTWRVISDNTDEITGAVDDVIEAIQDAQEQNQEYHEQEQQAVENIENQTTNDTASQLPDTSSATSLIGNIQNIFTQIGNIPAGNCSIPANWGNLNLGNLNLCTGKENMPFIVTFGAYAFELIFVIGASIILVRQVANMFDWARGDN